MLIKTIDGGEKKFYFTTKLSNNIEILDNGFMRCNNVVMGGVGTQQYTTKELNIQTSDGVVHVINVNRYEEDVFHPDTLKSAEGMAVTEMHPRNDDGSIRFVTADNVNELGRGYVLNVRRDGNDIVGDIIIKDKQTIDELQKRILNKDLPKVSLGYVAKYELDGNDSLKQTNIVMNHLAFMKQNANGRYSNARFVDEANQEIEESRGEKHLDKDTLFTKFLRVFGIKKATLDDDTEITVEDENVDETPKVDDIKQVVDETVVTEEPKEEKTVDETIPPVVEQPVGDDSTHVVKTTVEEHHDGEYYEETRVLQTVEKTVMREKTEEEINQKKKENTNVITLDEALKKIEALSPLKGTEAYNKQIATVDAEMVEAGLGSILTKADGAKIDIFNTVVPKTQETGDEKQVPKFKGNDFIKGIGAVYAQFTPKALDKHSHLTVDRAMRIKELSSVEAQDLIS